LTAEHVSSNLPSMSTSHQRFKDAVFDQISRVGKALASPQRLHLIDLLTQAPRTVEALAEETGLSIANTSQHLRALRSAHLVERRKSGLFVQYRLADPSIASLYLSVRDVAEERLAELPRLVREEFGNEDELEPIDREELVRRVRKGAAIVIDVRPANEYAAGHLPGAISIPLKELRRRLGELKKSSEIIAYCRGPYCVYARDAVRLLRKSGYRAHRLDLGVADWRMRGLRVMKSKAQEGSSKDK
jgi:rhodanese-related sulfurtransferase